MEKEFSVEQRAEQIKKQKAEAEARRKKRRNRKIAAMVCGCAAIVLLAVGSSLLTKYNAKKQAEEEAKDLPQIAVATLPASGRVDTITFTDNTGVQRSFTQDEAGNWSWADDAQFPVDEEQLDTMLESVAQLNAFIQFEPRDGQQYGLEQPQQTVILTDSQSGEYNTLYLGAVNDVSGQLYLKSGEDGTALYSVDASLIDTFNHSLFELMTAETVPMPEGSSDITGFSVVSPGMEKLQFAAWEDKDQVDLTGSVRWSMTQGDISLPVDSTTGTTLLGRLVNLQPETCVAWKAEDAELEKYGLDEESRTILDLRYTDADGEAAVTRIYIGNAADDGENCYMAVSGLNGVYLQTTEKLLSLVNATAADFATTMPFTVSGDYLTGVSIARDGETVLELEREVSEETDDEGNTTEVTAYTLNGELLTGTIGSSFVSTLVGLTGTDLKQAEAMPQQQADITVTLHLKNRAWPEATVYLYADEQEGYTAYYTRGTAKKDQQLLCVSLAAADWQSALDCLTAE